VAFKIAEAYVDIGARLGGLQKGIGAVKSAVGGLGKTLATTLGPIAAVVGGALAIKAAVTGWMEAEAAAEGLRAALAAHGADVDAILPKYEAFAAQIQSLTTIGDDEVNMLLRTATNLGLVGQAAQDAVSAGIELAEAFGGDVNAATVAVGQALNGSFKALQRNIPALRSATTNAERMAIVNKMAAAGMEQAKAKVNTLGGSWSRFTNAVGNASESIGQLITGPGVGILGFAQSAAEKFQKLVEMVIWCKDQFLTAFPQIGATAGSVSDWVGTKISAMISHIFNGIMQLTFMATHFDLFKDLMKEKANNLVTSVIDKMKTMGTHIKEIAVWFGENWRTILADMATNAVTIFTNIADNVKKLVQDMGKYIRSGGSEGFEEGFKGLTEGTKSIGSDLLLSPDVQSDMVNAAADRYAAEYKKFVEKFNKDTAPEDQLPDPGDLNLPAPPEKEVKAKKEKKKKLKLSTDHLKPKEEEKAPTGSVTTLESWLTSIQSGSMQHEKKMEQLTERQLKEQEKTNKFFTDVLSLTNLRPAF